MRACAVWVSVFVAFLMVFLIGRPAAAQPAVFSAFAFTAGEHDVLRNQEDGGEVGAELRFREVHLGFLPRFIPDFIPVLGAMRQSKGIVYGYAGFRLDVPVSERWVTTIGFGAGNYHHGEGKKLGGPVEFRSSIELARRFGESSRLGLALYHLSNAGLYEHNPGSESLVLDWTIGFGGRR
jgi:lipid A 3-O-deacylase